MGIVALLFAWAVALVGWLAAKEFHERLNVLEKRLDILEGDRFRREREVTGTNAGTGRDIRESK